jgi:hypothetical protein
MWVFGSASAPTPDPLLGSECCSRWPRPGSKREAIKRAESPPCPVAGPWSESSYIRRSSKVRRGSSSLSHVQYLSGQRTFKLCAQSTLFLAGTFPICARVHEVHWSHQVNQTCSHPHQPDEDQTSRTDSMISYVPDPRPVAGRFITAAVPALTFLSRLRRIPLPLAHHHSRHAVRSQRARGDRRCGARVWCYL